jgi:YVTN family beta-propeller protein
LKYVINKQKLYSIAFVPAAMGLMLISIAGAAPYAYITNSVSSNISVIDTATNQVTATVKVGNCPIGVTITPDGTKVHVVNYNGGNLGSVSVIDTATKQVTSTVNVGYSPVSFGQFIG